MPESGGGTSESSSSDEEARGKAGESKVPHGGAPVSEYEKQRQSRIAENRARIEALGLTKLASSLMVGSSESSRNEKAKGKKVRFGGEDDDYRPEDEPGSISSSDDDDDNGGNERQNSVSKKVRKTASNPKKKASSVKKVSRNPDYINDDDDEAFKMAVALSLQESGLSSSEMVNPNTDETRKNEKPALEDSMKNKRKKSFTSRLQMTDDELLLHFYQFDESWNDGISVRDLERVAIAHDFTWTDKELADMICCFDSDDDGKLSLDDFRKIAIRCKMIKGSEGQ